MTHPDMQFHRFKAWAEDEGYDTAHTFNNDRNRWHFFNPMTADLWRAWQAATASGVPVADRLHPECAWCTFCGKTDHRESQCPTVTAGVATAQPGQENGRG